MRTLFLGIVLAVCTASSVAAEGITTVPVAKNFLAQSLTWSQGGEMHLRWKVVTLQNKPYLCGAVAHSSITTKRYNRILLRKGWLQELGKKRKIFTDLSFFTSVRVGDDIDAAKASCKPIRYDGGKTVFQLGFDPTRVRL